ncbi:uncharacterized protein LOC113352643 [Papaver somniferum]|uniref:uncharacterized protein LOC113352643 n=1 Tax=Papaver somniferum TaxID=3469 RepID=UPI000E70131B|nr:uncharacterized protein LOC113352643 [Papaver somniferum]
MSECDWTESSLKKKARREENQSYAPRPCSSANTAPFQPRQSHQRSASQLPRNASASPTPSFVDQLRDLGVSLPSGAGWVSSRLHISSIHPLMTDTVRGQGELPVSPSAVLQSMSPSGSSRSVFGGSSSHVALDVNDSADISHLSGSTSDSESSSSSSTSLPKVTDTPLGSSITEDMGKKRKEAANPDMDGARRVVPSGDRSVKRTKVDSGSSSVPPEKQADAPVTNTSTTPIVTGDPEDAQFPFPLVVSAAEAEVDPFTHTLVHDFWVPTVFAANYRDIVERGGGHMAKFPIAWLKELLVKVKSRNDPRGRLTSQISQLEERLQRCSEATSSKKVVLDLLLIDVGSANDEVLQAEAAKAKVRAELKEKRRELEKL